MDESGGGPQAEATDRRAQRTARIGLTVAAIGLAGVIAAAWNLRPMPPPQATASPQPPITSPEPVAPPAEEKSAEPAPTSDGARIDVVRVEPDGSALIAGSAPAGATVVILLDGVETAPARVDGAGKFVTFLMLGAGREPRLLSARVEMPDGQRIDGTETVVIAPAALASAPEAPSDAVQPAAASPDDTTPEAPATAEIASAPAPAVVAAGPSGLRVLGAVEGVAIDTMAYVPDGLRFGGRGAPGSQLRLYVDNRPVAEVEIDGDGAWQVVLSDIAQGDHALRADLLDPAGAVGARYELPFIAEDAPQIAAATAGGPAVRVVTIQPGQSLWRIAQDRYGDGAAYVRLFEANRSRIRDPDLIYPGQTFDIPD